MKDIGQSVGSSISKATLIGFLVFCFSDVLWSAEEALVVSKRNIFVYSLFHFIFFL